MVSSRRRIYFAQGIFFVRKYFSYVLIAASLNFISSLFAASIEEDYREAQSFFEQRDLSSREKAISLLEKILEQKPDHLEAQALISYVYAHEAYILSQLDKSGAEYQNSADAFSKAVLSQQPSNVYARKTVLFLKLMAGNKADVETQIEKNWPQNERDADVWYFRALVGEGPEALKALQEAFKLNTAHVWIYSDMAFRALRVHDYANAEKWIAALQKQRADIADIDLLKASFAAQKGNEKEMRTAWDTFVRKVPDSSIVSRFKTITKK